MANKPMQLPLWKPESSWRPPRVCDLPSWEGVKRVGFDCETKDPHLKQLGPGCRRADSHMIGFSFAFEDGPSHYVPLRHEGGDNVEDPEQGLRYLRDQAKHFPGILVGAHLAYDLDWAATEDAHFAGVSWLRDVQLADPLIDELKRSYSLEAISQRHELPGKKTELLVEAARHYNVDPKGGMWQLPARFVGPYAGEDARLPLLILRRQERLIDDQHLQGVFDLESQVLPVLVKMRRRGVRFSSDRLHEIEKWSLDQEAEALAKIKHLTGVSVAVGDVWKSGALAPALEAIGVKLKRNKDGSPSIDKELLTALSHPVANAILWARKTNKLRTTFAQSIRTHAIDDRIHCSYNQLRATSEFGNERGAAFGRLSSENPNMQQQPARDEFAKMWRSIYLPEEGSEWGSLDYSQQEPRMLFHYAELVGLHGAGKVAQEYRDNPKTDSHQMMADITGVERTPAKELFLGTCYGMGGAKLCGKLGLGTRLAAHDGFPPIGNGHREYFALEDRDKAEEYCKLHKISLGWAHINGRGLWEVAGEEGQAIMDKFHERLPFVKALAKKCRKNAESKGFIRTLSGRRCRFPMKRDPKPGDMYDWIHKALNRLIQGGSADQTKKAMVEADAAGYFIQLQVHDEITGSFANRDEANAMARIMENCYDLNIPFVVDVEMGPSWGEAT